MKVKYNVIQCVLENDGYIFVTWIPEKYAKVGKVISLYHNDEWNDGWEVMKVGNKKFQSNDMLNSTKVNDIVKRYDNNI